MFPHCRKEDLLKHREYLKKRKQKKQEKMKELEKVRETDKNKWLSFKNKAINKSKKGVTKQSIFRSPETVDGRVGVGTCGLSGKGMTDFKGAKKYQRNVRKGIQKTGTDRCCDCERCGRRGREFWKQYNQQIDNLGSIEEALLSPVPEAELKLTLALALGSESRMLIDETFPNRYPTRRILNDKPERFFRCRVEGNVECHDEVLRLASQMRRTDAILFARFREKFCRERVGKGKSFVLVFVENSVENVMGRRSHLSRFLLFGRFLVSHRRRVNRFELHVLMNEFPFAGFVCDSIGDQTDSIFNGFVNESIGDQTDSIFNGFVNESIGDQTDSIFNDRVKIIDATFSTVHVRCDVRPGIFELLLGDSKDLL
ncbi:unnamed protein product [Notodromas monacha]|uniref:Uncharacterized protein n=1 Tax=Notodromas monacha TaxID=399045 RepID=A0A7R9G9T5_9CRUS|nr:unnamed protein product [Notodromas monacha]CAG0914588.1 unnamed protein product [Notodromas monacha]